MDQPTKSKVVWRNIDVVKCFLETCIQEVSNNGRCGGSLKAESWSKVRAVLKEVHSFEATQKQMKNHYDYLKEKYQAWLPLYIKTGNIYNHATNTFNMTDTEWDDYIKTHPKAKTLRTSPLPYPDLCRALFEGATATGVHGWGPSSTTPRSGESSANPTRLQLLGIEDIPDTFEDNESSNFSNTASESYASQSRASDPNVEGEKPRKKRKGKTTINNSSLDEQMSNALNLIVQTNSAPTVGKCVEKLKKLGWGENSLLYLAAVAIFCEGPSYREAWMMFSDDDKESMVGWVTLVAGKLGYKV